MREGRFLSASVVVVLAGLVALVLWIAARVISSVEFDVDSDETAVDAAAEPAAKPNAAARTPAPRGPGALVGSVRVFGTDKPVARAKVTITAACGFLDATTRDDGSFAFVGVPKADDWTLTVASDAPGEARLAGIVVVARQTTDVGVVYLAPQFGVPGAVVDERGRPIGGVTVVVMETRPKKGFDVASLVRELPRPATSALETQTGADGRFRLTGLPPGTYLVYAKKPGFAAAVATSVTVAPTASLPLRLVMEKGYRVAGRVVRTGAGPVAGIPVVAVCMNDMASFFDTAIPRKILDMTDAAGAFAFDGLCAGKWWIFAAPSGEALSQAGVVVVPRWTFVELRLDGGASLAGRVTGGDDAPVPGAEVLCESGETVAIAPTDSDGRYEMRGLATGTARRFVVHADGYCSLGADTIFDPARRADAAFVLKAGANTRDVKLVVGGTVRGVVVEDGTTTAVPAATVTVLSGSSFLDVAPSSTTDDAGRFEIVGVPVGAAVLVVKKPGWCQAGADLSALLQALRPFGADETPAEVPGPGSSAGFVVAKQGDDVERTIRMARAVVLRGRVLGPDGGPVAGARVEASVDPSARRGFAMSLAEEASGGGDSSRLTDAEGRFEIAVPVAAGKVHLEATAPGFRKDGKYDIEIGGATPPPDIELKLSLGGTIEGRVTDASGAPIEGAAVSWRRPSDTAWDPLMQSLLDLAESSDDRGRTTTGADGAYRLALVNPDMGSITLDVGDGRHVAVRRDGLQVADGKTLRVDLTLEGGLSITGRVSRLDGARPANAWVEVHRDGGEAGKNDASGDESTTAPDGTFRVAALAAGKYRLIGHARGAADGAPVVVDAGAEGVELRLAAQLPIAGVVKFRDGRPAVGAVVTATPRHREARTGDDGAFRIESLDPGEYALDVLAGPSVTDANFRGTGVGDVAAGEIDVVVEVESGLTISGDVLAPDGAPAASGFVRCRLMSDGEEGKESEATIRAGRFVLKGLAPGKYVVSVKLRGFSAPPLTADAGATDVKLRLMKNGAIKGRVLLPDGKPAWNADVVLDDNDVASPSDSTQEDGGFTVGDVAPGLHRVTALDVDDGVHYVGEIRDVRVVEGCTTEGVEIKLTKRE